MVFCSAAHITAFAYLVARFSMAISLPVCSFNDTVGCIAILLFLLLPLFILRLFFTGKGKGKGRNLPPGPPGLPILGNLLHLRLYNGSFEDWIKKLQAKYGPIFTVRIGSHPLIIITSHELAHTALSEKGSIFADRPPARGGRKILSSNQHSINSAPYGSLWRLLRRNLITQTLNPSSLSSYKPGREWAIQSLVQTLRNQSAQNDGIVPRVVENFRFAVFCILLYICFGFQLEEDAVRDVETALREIILSGGRFALDEVFPVLGILFRKRRGRVEELRRGQIRTLLPLVEKRRQQLVTCEAVSTSAYVDSLVSLVLPDGRNLSDDEMVTLCSEFINAGTDTTSTALQWIMANLVINQNVQSKLYEEILRVVGTHRNVEEEDVQRMPYLNAVVKEGLRRHPPGHFVLSHAVTQECTLAGYAIPTNASVNFYIAGMSIDPNLWENASDFVPQRFMGTDHHIESDMSGSKETKMMTFGAGRRVCPGLGLALLHLHLIVARLVQSFEWRCVPGQTVDLSEKQEFTTVMKNPLQALLTQRPPIHHSD